MKKGEAKKYLVHLFSLYAKARGTTPAPDYHASFSDFKSWLSDNGYSHYLDFRSVAGSNYDAEMWFDDYFKQAWRN